MRFVRIFPVVILPFLMHGAVIAESPRDGEKLGPWAFTRYLKGTTAEVHTALFAEVERFIGMIDENKKSIAELSKRLELRHKETEKVLADDDGHKKAIAEADKAEALLEVARKGGDESEIANAVQNKLNKKRAVNLFRLSIVDNDQQTLDLARKIADAKKRLPELSISLGKAESWRRESVAIILSGLTPRAPLRAGSRALIEDFSIEKIIDSRTVLGTTTVDRPVPNTESEKEGFRLILVRPTTTRILLSNIDTSRLVRGEDPRILKSVRFGASSGLYGEDIYSATVVNDEIQELVDSITEMPGNLSKDEMDKFVRLASSSDSKAAHRKPGDKGTSKK